MAIVKGDDGNAQYDLGYVYHTTHWGQNTYPSDGKLSPCTRALVVPGYKHLIEPVRSAVGRSWLELSKHKGGHPAYTYISRPENHQDVVSAALSVGEASASTNSCGSPVDEASTGTNPRDWQFPDMPNHASQDTIDSVKSIIDQCRLVCPPESAKEIKFKMVRRLLFTWLLQSAEVFQRDRALCTVIFPWLQQLLITTTAEQLVIAG